MFAGPNGSGKSTMKALLKPEWLGVYLNPDEIERSIRQTGLLDLDRFGVAGDEDALTFFRDHPLIRRAGLLDAAQRLTLGTGGIDFASVEVNAYFASVAADLLRRRLLKHQVSFTFETVMSASDKVELLFMARNLGYRTYLYYVATDDPAINISRVRARVAQGGHPVPEDKIVSRYFRSLDLLLDAIRHTDRAFVFDNSTTDAEPKWVAETSSGKDIEIKADPMPAWFHQAVWQKAHGIRRPGAAPE
jgi:predicted ABC-type ATPase